ncbi:putative PAS/PAC sensor protein [Rippkaea orientalis PCC 8801]|uniref:Putative PAS/PAC sensor protein n=1 Tax=Rippkaea orientalis (strain PCC 8801 / RF-1) TaxID=41431 RepID=B7K4S0_RIPO1|nr:SpoIIE family protein phosphatase [Rippkaea orientalis]ACK66576.1 putative PAS/PAC sensor protein [Rippkaea orientalis PCC 8801]
MLITLLQKFQYKIPLRTVLVVPFVIQIVGAVGLVGYLSFRNGQKAVEDLAGQLTNEVSNVIIERLNSYLGTPHLVNQLNKNALNLGQLNLQNIKAIERHFWQQAQVFELVSKIQFAGVDGKFIGLAINDDGTLDYQERDRSGDLQTYAINSQGNRRERLRTYIGFDARLQPWYIASERAGKPVWSQIYPWVSPPTLAITLGESYYDKNGKFQGVLATDLTLLQISDFLRSLKIGRSGKTFIIESSGQLVASSSAKSPFLMVDNQPQRLSATNLEDSLIRPAAFYLQKTLGNIKTASPEDIIPIDIPQKLKFKIHGKHHFMKVLPFQDDFGLDWYIVIVVPESDFMQQIEANNKTTFALVIAALILATTLGLLTSRWIVELILQLNQAAQQIAEGNLKTKVNIKGIKELESLGITFNVMANQIKDYFEALEAKNEDLEQAKADLLEAKEKLETILDAVPGSISWIDSQGFYLGVNRYLSDKWNLPAEEFIGKPIGFLQGNDHLIEFLFSFLESSKDADSQVVEITFNDCLEYYLIAAQKYQGGNATVSIGINITERKKAEEKLTQTVKELSDIKYALDQLAIVTITDAQGNINYVNDKFCEVSQYSPEELIGNNHRILKSGYHDRAFYKELWSTISSGQIWQGEIKNKTKDGAFYWVNSTIIPFLDKTGRPFQYLSIRTEITARKELEQTLESIVSKRTAQLAAANQEITDLNNKLRLENVRMSAELNVVFQMQQMILPKVEELRGIEGLELAGFMKPAAEVGGDYYDVLHHDGIVTLGIGDVTGHGLESGILMVMTQTAVRTLKEIGETDPIRFLSALNRTIYQNLQRMNSDKNLSLGILHYYQRQLRISGQHEEILLVRSGGKIERINTIDLGFPIGLDHDISHFVDQVCVELNPGDGVILYTDGITEAKDINRNFYGLNRLCDVVSQSWQKSAQEIQEAVIEDVYQHIGEQKVFDDITLLVLKQK